MNFSWPSAPLETLALAEVLLAWSVVNYVLARDPIGFQEIRSSLDNNLRWTYQVVIRSLMLGVVTFLIVGWSLPGVALAVLAFTGAAILPLGRRLLVARGIKAEAEWEVCINILFTLSAGSIVGHAQLGIAHPLIRVPLSAERLIALTMAGTALAFAGQGATHIVRGILDKVGTVPRARPGSEEIDSSEYNRGRVIGTSERGLMLLTVALGSYAALGFLVAAKGLIRIKEFEDREFAEYFLVGTLASVLIALVLGLLVRTVFLEWWS